MSEYSCSRCSVGTSPPAVRNLFPLAGCPSTVYLSQFKSDGEQNSHTPSPQLRARPPWSRDVRAKLILRLNWSRSQPMFFFHDSELGDSRGVPSLSSSIAFIPSPSPQPAPRPEACDTASCDTSGMQPLVTTHAISRMQRRHLFTRRADRGNTFPAGRVMRGRRRLGNMANRTCPSLVREGWSSYTCPAASDCAYITRAAEGAQTNERKCPAQVQPRGVQCCAVGHGGHGLGRSAGTRLLQRTHRV